MRSVVSLGILALLIGSSAHGAELVVSEPRECAEPEELSFRVERSIGMPLSEAAALGVRRLDRLTIQANPNLDLVELGALETVDELSVLGNPRLSTAELSSVRTFESTIERNADDPAP